MGNIYQHRPVMLICAVVSKFPDAFVWARERLVEAYGDILLESDEFEFVETSFYEKTMGANLRKQFLTFENLIAPETLPSVKIATNDFEEQYKTTHEQSVDRPLNLDPGYITEAKLVLATTKDRDHRLYMNDGIFAEVTLHYHKGDWRKNPWTYPDYQREDFQQFFTACRTKLRSLYKLDSSAQ